MSHPLPPPEAEPPPPLPALVAGSLPVVGNVPLHPPPSRDPYHHRERVRQSRKRGFGGPTCGNFRPSLGHFYCGHRSLRVRVPRRHRQSPSYVWLAWGIGAPDHSVRDPVLRIVAAQPFSLWGIVNNNLPQIRDYSWGKGSFDSEILFRDLLSLHLDSDLGDLPSLGLGREMMVLPTLPRGGRCEVFLDSSTELFPPLFFFFSYGGREPRDRPGAGWLSRGPRDAPGVWSLSGCEDGSRGRGCGGGSEGCRYKEVLCVWVLHLGRGQECLETYSELTPV